MLLMLTDGEITDAAVFLQELENAPQVHLTFGVLGFGGEHDIAMAGFQRLQTAHPDRIQVIPFNKEITAEAVTSAGDIT